MIEWRYVTKYFASYRATLDEILISIVIMERLTIYANIRDKYTDVHICKRHDHLFQSVYISEIVFFQVKERARDWFNIFRTVKRFVRTGCKIKIHYKRDRDNDNLQLFSWALPSCFQKQPSQRPFYLSIRRRY